jgi:hypothetical protein
MKNFHIKPALDIRWRLEYSDGRAPRWGQWTRPERDPKNMASFMSRQGLARAFIEVRDKRTFKTSTPVHCAGHDFVMFKWEYMASIAMTMNNFKEYSPTPQVAGLKLVTSKIEATVMVDGSSPIIRARPESDLNYNYACF